MSKQILFEFERGGQITATLLGDKAPKTCKAVLSSLPVEKEVRHAMWAGEEIFFDDFPCAVELPYENATNSITPGDIAVISQQNLLSGIQKGYVSFCIFYGKGRPRKSMDTTVDVNVFARIDDVEGMANICKRVRLKGTEKMKIRVKA